MILGVDPGLATFGWAVMKQMRSIERRLVAVGLIETKPNKTLAYYDDFYRRMGLIEESLEAVIDEYRPIAIAVEAFSYPRQARSATYLAGAHAQLRATASQWEIPLVQLKRSFVLGVVGVEAHGRGRKQRREEIKSGVIRFCREIWPDAEWPKAKTKAEHPCDAATTALALMESPMYMDRALRKKSPEIICSL